MQALLRQRPQLHEPGARRPRALASRADVLLASALLDEAEEVVKLLEKLGISPAQLGPLAEAGGLGPAALKASAAIRALVESQLSGEPLTLKGVSEEERSLPAGFDKKLDELLGSSPAAQRLRATILR